MRGVLEVAAAAGEFCLEGMLFSVEKELAVHKSVM